MSKRFVNKYFHIGKGIYNDNTRISLKGIANTNIDTYNKNTGRMQSRKKIGENGLVIKDYDFKDDFHDENHVHDYHWINNKPKRINGRKPTKVENREIKKCERKRKTYNARIK